MSAGIKRPHAMALKDAEAFRNMFPAGCYHRWEFAGSLRRGKAEVGDIEHLVIPAFGEVERGDGLFRTVEMQNLLFRHLEAMVSDHVVTKHIYGDTGFRWGPLYRGVDWRGFLHEIWCADESSWGWKLLIRTGPDTYSRRIVTALRDGGMYRQQDGALIHVASGETVNVPDERRYCELAGVRYLEPEART